MKTLTLYTVLVASIAMMTPAQAKIEYDHHLHTDAEVLFSTFGADDESSFIHTANDIIKVIKVCHCDVTRTWWSDNSVKYELEFDSKDIKNANGETCYGYALMGPDKLWTDGHMCKDKNNQWSIK